jgi:hypothetical protein
MKTNDILLPVLSVILIGGAFWMTYRNSPKHGYMVLGVVALSFVVGQIKDIQMFSLLGIVGVLVLMVMSRNVREKAIQNWLQENHFVFAKNENGANKFANNSAIGSNRYYCYKNEILLHNQRVPFDFVIRMNTTRINNTSSLVIHSSFYFQENMDVAAVEQKLLKAKENTPKSHFAHSHFGYFDLKDCEIFRPAQGGVAVCWRTPDTVEGYNERYEWVKNALNH